jgi:LPPG:FO 2-phospho-L-lactate transferase
MAGDTFTAMERLAAAGEDISFRLGDIDLALCLERTRALEAGESLSAIVAGVAATLGVKRTVLPATDGALRTRIKTTSGEWLAFQDYFVLRHAMRSPPSSTPAPG